MPLKSRTRQARVSLFFIFLLGFCQRAVKWQTTRLFSLRAVPRVRGSLERRARRLEVRIWLTWIRWVDSSRKSSRVEQKKKKGLEINFRPMSESGVAHADLQGVTEIKLVSIALHTPTHWLKSKQTLANWVRCNLAQMHSRKKLKIVCVSFFLSWCC